MIKRTWIIFIVVLIVLYSCSRKSHPSKSTTPAVDSIALKNTTDSLQAAKIVAKRKAKLPVSKTIEVNDNVAHKSVDGRLYYDVMGHRYWKNYKDGKYYLFNKSMYNNNDFKPAAAASQ